MPIRWHTDGIGRVVVDGDSLGEPTSLSPSYAALFDRVASRWGGLAKAQAARTGNPESWEIAFLFVESSGNERAVSPAGAVGLYQLMPEWWAGHSEEQMMHADINARLGSNLIALLRAKQPELPIVASIYNCGGHADGSPKRPTDETLYPWGLCENTLTQADGSKVRSHYIALVSAANNYAIEQGGFRGVRTGAGATSTNSSSGLLVPIAIVALVGTERRWW